ncbi:hypothetical protein ACNKHU_20065 [Shigella flexneri]
MNNGTTKTHVGVAKVVEFHSFRRPPRQATDERFVHRQTVSKLEDEFTGKAIKP